MNAIFYSTHTIITLLCNVQWFNDYHCVQFWNVLDGSNITPPPPGGLEPVGCTFATLGARVRIGISLAWAIPDGEVELP